MSGCAPLSIPAAWSLTERRVWVVLLVSTFPGGGCQLAFRTPFDVIWEVLTLAYHVAVQAEPIGMVAPACDGLLVVASIACPREQSTLMLSVTSTILTCRVRIWFEV